MTKKEKEIVTEMIDMSMSGIRRRNIKNHLHRVYGKDATDKALIKFIKNPLKQKFIYSFEALDIIKTQKCFDNPEIILRACKDAYPLRIVTKAIRCTKNLDNTYFIENSKDLLKFWRVIFKEFPELDNDSNRLLVAIRGLDTPETQLLYSTSYNFSSILMKVSPEAIWNYSYKFNIKKIISSEKIVNFLAAKENRKQLIMLREARSYSFLQHLMEKNDKELCRKLLVGEDLTHIVNILVLVHIDFDKKTISVIYDKKNFSFLKGIIIDVIENPTEEESIMIENIKNITAENVDIVCKEYKELSNENSPAHVLGFKNFFKEESK